MPNLLLKAKNIISKLGQAKALKDAAKSNEAEGQTGSLKAFMGLSLVFTIIFPVILFFMVIVVIVALPQMFFTIFGAVTDHSKSNSYSGDLAYLQWAIDIANDDSHGYSQCNRTGSPDYDCSSLVWYSLVDGQGFDANAMGGYAFSTCGEGDILKQNGFKEYTYTSHADLQPGDILVRDPCGPHGHTEIYVGEDKTVGAHTSESGLCGAPGDQTGHEIDVGVSSSSWETYYRLEG